MTDDKGWPKRWWTAALLAVGLTGVVIHNVRRAVRILAEPAVDRWDLLGPCLGGIWFALLAAHLAHRAITLHREAPPVEGETQAGH